MDNEIFSEQHCPFCLYDYPLPSLPTVLVWYKTCILDSFCTWLIFLDVNVKPFHSYTL